MFRITLCCCFLICSLKPTAQANDLPPYLSTYKDIAIQEMNRSGIPASIILAQGIVESAWGKATLAQAANNHFGIKCKSDWMGDAYLLEDDDYDGNGNLIESCFRVYPDVLSSYRDHSNFLMEGQRYQSLFELDKADYKGWAHGLKACGYATDPAYAEKLIRKIEEYQLYRFDTKEVVMDAPAFEIPYSAGSVENDSSSSTMEEASPNAGQPSMMLSDDFGLITQPIATEAIIQPIRETSESAILSSPTYKVPASNKD